MGGRFGEWRVPNPGGPRIVQTLKQRLAARIACDVPLRIRVDGAWRHVKIVDVSRTGVRVLVPLHELGLEHDTSLADVARFLGHVVAEQLPAQFHPARLGDLVTRQLTIVRLGLDAGGAVELGCTMSERLGDIEAAALGLDVPQEGEGLEEEAPREVVASRSAPASGRETPSRIRLRVVVTPPEGSSARMINVPVEEIDASGITLRFQDRAALRGPLEDADDADDVPSLAYAFSEAYGPTARLEIVSGEASIYKGAATLQKVEVEPTRPDELLAGFVFGRELEPAERRALRIA